MSLLRYSTACCDTASITDLGRMCVAAMRSKQALICGLPLSAIHFPPSTKNSIISAVLTLSRGGGSLLGCMSESRFNAGVANCTFRSRDFWTVSLPSTSEPLAKNGAATVVLVIDPPYVGIDGTCATNLVVAFDIGKARDVVTYRWALCTTGAGTEVNSDFIAGDHTAPPAVQRQIEERSSALVFA